MSVSVLLGTEHRASYVPGQHCCGITLPSLLYTLRLYFKPSYYKRSRLLGVVNIESVNTDGSVPPTVVVTMTTFNNGI